jgi:hypothetical protein
MISHTVGANLCWYRLGCRVAITPAVIAATNIGNSAPQTPTSRSFDLTSTQTPAALPETFAGSLVVAANVSSASEEPSSTATTSSLHPKIAEVEAKPSKALAVKTALGSTSLLVQPVQPSQLPQDLELAPPLKDSSVAPVTLSPMGSEPPARGVDELSAVPASATAYPLEAPERPTQESLDDPLQDVSMSVSESTTSFVTPDKRAAQGDSRADTSTNQRPVADAADVGEVSAAVNPNMTAPAPSKQNPSFSAGKGASPKTEQDQPVSTGYNPKKITAVTGPEAPVTTVDQVATLIRAGESLPVTTPAVAQADPDAPVLSVSVSPKTTGKENSKEAPKDGVEAKLPEASPTIVPGGVAAAPSIPVADRSYQAKDATTIQVVAPPNGITLAHFQSVSTPIPAQIATNPSVSESHAVKTSDTPNLIPAPVEQPLPVINAAKLIQNIGQTEMHVGMRSAEFGNISIRTSSTSDLISAQISLDHSDLAKVLASHVPEMQEKLGGNQPGSVQIETNAAGSSTGSSSSSANGSPEDSQRPRQQQSGTDYSNRNGREEAAQYLHTAVAMNSSSANSRLDVHI